MAQRVIRLAATACAVLWLSGACRSGPDIELGPPQRIAEGVELYHVADANVFDAPGPVDIHLLRIDPAHVELESALAHDEIMGPEPVADMAVRHGALAAINAGFFSTTTGEPAGLLQIEGELVSDTPLTRGAVGISRLSASAPQRLLFDRVGAGVTLVVERGAERAEMPIDGVDTTRVRGQLMLFTPRYHADTDTAPNGTEWQLRGQPLKVVERRESVGKMPIPRDGAVLSYGGTVLPTALEGLHVGDEVRLTTRFVTEMTSPQEWALASDIVGGAGLLLLRGRPTRDWAIEKLRSGFETERHPRTMIGVGRGNAIWLIVVDGRQPNLSVGMNFAELQQLAQALRLSNALNLDGGGSTTMVVRGQVVNHPSDAAGPRKVSDALIVRAKKSAP